MTAFSKRVLKALTAAILTAAVLIFVSALIAYTRDDPAALTGILGLICFLLACFGGGIVAVREGNILSVLVFAAVFILICFGVNLACQSDRGALALLLTYLGGLGSAMIGALLFGSKKTKKPKNLKRYNKYNKIKRK